MLTIDPGKISERKFLVFGAARSGIAASRLLRREGANVVLVDDKPAESFAAVRQELDEMGVTLHFGALPPRVLDGIECVIVSPGVPADHALLTRAHSMSIPVVSEIELGFSFSAAPIVAVTGTNGKTTTAMIIAGILRGAGRHAALGGNIGRAFCDLIVSGEAAQPATIFVLEISSYQLEHIRAFRPYVAVVLNITPDHLDRHQTLEKYIEVKGEITRNQRSDNFLILNADDQHCMRIEKQTQASLFTFSRKTEVERGAFLRGQDLILRSRSGEQILCRRSDIALPGMHNVENVLAAVCAAWLLDIEPPVIAQAVTQIKGVEHRIEFVARVDDVSFYNDSKATNLDSLEKALLSFESPVVLIAGGQYKHNNYDVLRPLVWERVKHLILLGEAKPHIRRSWTSDTLQPIEVETMADAVAQAKRVARCGDVVLLSPGCKSYDQYQNFEYRGNDFKYHVRRLLEARGEGAES